MLNWGRARVRNFTKDFATAYVRILVALDGRPYDQAMMFDRLADAGLVRFDASKYTAEELPGIKAKRWDSYNNKIREFGLGFAIEETRKGGPPKARTIWRASPISKELDNGLLTFRQFMAVQMARFQLPKAGMPLQAAAKAELVRGAQVRPFRLLLQAMERLAELDEGVYLSRQEIDHFLPEAERHDQLVAVVDEIVTARHAGAEVRLPDSADASGSEDVDDTAQPEGDVEPEGDAPAGQAYGDIYLNEFSLTGYFLQLRPPDGRGLPTHILVRNLERWEEARRLDEAFPVQTYGTDVESIDAYFNFVVAVPSDEVRRILMSKPRVVEIAVPTDAQFDPDRRVLIGTIDLLGAIAPASLVVLKGDLPPGDLATVFSAGVLSFLDGGQGELPLAPEMIRSDLHAVDTLA